MSFTRILRQLGSSPVFNHAPVRHIYSGSHPDEVASYGYEMHQHTYGDTHAHFFDKHGNHHLHTQAVNHGKDSKLLHECKDTAHAKTEFRAW